MDPAGYRIGPSFAGGGAGTLRLAMRREGLGLGRFARVVVVKRLRDDPAADPVANELLLHEARIAARSCRPGRRS